MEENKKLLNRNKINEIMMILLSLVLIFGSVAFGIFSYIWISDLDKNLINAYSNLDKMEDKYRDLKYQNTALNEKNNLFENQINEISGTVNNLDKLSKTDKELLQKYSKVYFLNEHYIPSDLSVIKEDYKYNKNKELLIHSGVAPFLDELMDNAKKEEIDLKILSAYRSFGEQSAIKSNYTVTYGTGANKFSADQGYSEHQLGTTIDFTTQETGNDFSMFKDTKAYSWLLKNAHKYGFILSYPENNEYYEFEPWHWRFVGKNLSNRLYEDKQNFYDLNQSIINAYLLSIFERK